MSPSSAELATGQSGTGQAGFLAQIGAVVRRDLSIQLSYQLELLMRAEAVLAGCATLFFLGHLVPQGHLGPYRGGYFEFALLGLVVTSFSSLGLRAFTSTISGEQREGTLEIVIAGPVRLSVLMAGVLIVPLGLTVLELLVYIGFGVGAIGAGLRASGLLLALPVLIVTVTSFSVLGIFSAAIVLVSKRGDPVVTLVSQAASFLGGAVFPVTLLPSWAQAAAHGVPAYYSLQGLRGALLGDASWSEILFNTGVLAAFTVALLPVSLWALRRALAFTRATGTLGTY